MIGDLPVWRTCPSVAAITYDLNTQTRPPSLHILIVIHRGADARMSDFRGPLDRPTDAPFINETTVRTATVRTGGVVPDVAESHPAARRSVWSYVKTTLKVVTLLMFGYVALVVALLVAYRWINPPTTTLIAMQRAGGTLISRTWVPLERISPNLQRAVVMSEDARFCSHGGIDWREIEEAFDRSQDGVVRGGSTISMQVAKNLFLWPSKSYVRKALEIPITYGMEQLWPKRRILEIYLNIAEWGPGVFGAEAAASITFASLPRG